MDFSTALLLWLIGIAIGTYGTLIGVGGGVVLVPLLLYLYPEHPPRIITSISFAVVFFNAISGTFAYRRLKRIDYKTGLAFSAATIPGVVLGTILTFFLSRSAFQIAFGILLTAVSVYIFLRPRANPIPVFKGQCSTRRLITDCEGVKYDFSFNLRLGIVISFLVGFVAGLLGIGGGVIHVPAMVSLLGFPAHIATATSHFILVITTFFGVVTHAIAGDLTQGWLQIVVLSVGVIIGAQIGARLSSKVGGTTIIRLLALALLFLGVRLLWTWQ
jgi:hypothetical protein